MASTLTLYGTTEDHFGVLTVAEEILGLQYVQATLHFSANPPIFSSACQIDSLGIARVGKSAFERQYLILPSGTLLQTREVHLFTGDIRYIVDHYSNPDSVLFSPGGLYEDRCVIAGMLVQPTSERMAAILFRTLAQCYRSAFTKTKNAYIGDHALALFREGFRLTSQADPDRTGDLTP
jgi:hypothetical protein